MQTNFKPFNMTPGLILYHTTGFEFTQLRDGVTWFTPYLEQVDGYRHLVQLNGKKPRTLACEVLGGNFIHEDSPELKTIVERVWGSDEEVSPLYSKFDVVVGEYDQESIEEFISLLKNAGYDGCVHLDYDSVDNQKDAYTVCIFDPNKFVKMVSEF